MNVWIHDVTALLPYKIEQLITLYSIVVLFFFSLCNEMSIPFVLIPMTLFSLC